MGSIYKRKGKWRAEVRTRGFYRSRTFIHKHTAEKWMREVEVGFEKAGSVEATYTVAEAIDKYIKEVCPKHKGKRWEIIRLNKFKTCALAEKTMQSVRPPDLAEWRDQRLGEGLAETSVARELSLWSGLFSTAEKEWHWINENPVRKIKKPPKTKRRDRIINDKEVEKILEVLIGGRQRKHTAIIFQIALETGMRLSEILSIDRVKGNVAFLEDTKNNESREVPLTKKAKELINKGPFDITSESVSRIFRLATKKAGVRNVTFHDSRHTAATRLASKLHVLDLCRVFGWKDPRHAMIYYNPTVASLVDKLEENE